MFLRGGHLSEFTLVAAADAERHLCLKYCILVDSSDDMLGKPICYFRGVMFIL